jgi:hypothetical protein
MLHWRRTPQRYPGRGRRVSRHDLFVVLVFIQQFFAETEEIRMRQTVVFQNYSGFLFFKEPVNGGADRIPAAKVFIPEEGMQFTGPVNIFSYQVSHLNTFERIILVMFTRTVSGGVKPRRFSIADRGENPGRHIRSIEDQKQDRFI